MKSKGLCATHARTLLPAEIASVSFGFVLVRVRISTRRPPTRRLDGTDGTLPVSYFVLPSRRRGSEKNPVLVIALPRELFRFRIDGTLFSTTLGPSDLGGLRKKNKVFLIPPQLVGERELELEIRSIQIQEMQKDILRTGVETSVLQAAREIISNSY